VSPTTGQSRNSRIKRRPAHRPSRRDEIVTAAIEVFGEHGYAETSITDVAAAANVVASSVYYHFAGKNELFDEAIKAVYESLDSSVEAARAEHDEGSPEALTAVIDAANRWIDKHPRAARMLYSQLPGATTESQRLREEHEGRHVSAAYAYLGRGTRKRTRSDVSQHDPAATLAARTLVHLMISVMPLRLEGGPLSKRPKAALQESMRDVGCAIIFGV
jgi:AcrR family transcriptional regulator